MSDFKQYHRGSSRSRDGIEATAKAIVLAVLGLFVVLLARIFEHIVLN